MRRRAVWPHLVVWVLFVAYCTYGMLAPQHIEFSLGYFGPVELILPDLVFGAALLLGVPTLLRLIRMPERTLVRTMARLVTVYLLYQAVVVLPVALMVGTGHPLLVIRTLQVRAAWLLFPIFAVIMTDPRARKAAAIAPLIGAGVAAGWGVFSGLTDGAGFYYEYGEQRFRVLWGGATTLVAWPFAVGLTGRLRRSLAFGLVGIGLVGLALTNHRSGMLAFGATAVVALLAARNRSRILTWAVPLSLVGAAALIVWGGLLFEAFGYTLTRLFDVQQSTGADRLMRWGLAAEFFASRPINDFVWSWRYYIPDLADPYAPHNFVLEIAAVEGIVGLLFYGTVLGKLVRGASRWIRRDGIVLALSLFVFVYFAFAFANATMYSFVTAPLMVAGLSALAVRVDRLDRGEDVADSEATDAEVTVAEVSDADAEAGA